jgi:AcrR family transcriptional regulator
VTPLHCAALAGLGPRALYRREQQDGRLAARSRATEIALRRAALRLVAERGYEATTVDDIAQDAGVSADTFFLYFPNKETAVLFPDGLVAGLVLAGLSQRPAAEDPVVALVAAVIDTFVSINRLIGDDELLRGGIRVMLSEPSLQHVVAERRLGVETEAWSALRRRGVGGDDRRVRVATTLVVGLGFLALEQWVQGEGPASLAAALADCLRLVPERSLLEEGIDAAGVAAD